MRGSRRFPRFLLILAFVVGQWFAVVHATQHELSSPQEAATCSICAVAHSGGGVPTFVALLIAFTYAALVSDARPAGIVVRRAFLLPQGRAPPQFPR
jgi:hypothetical protein